MSLDELQSTLKRDHDSFSEKCGALGDLATASSCSRENFHSEFDTSSTLPLISVVATVPHSKSPISEIVASTQPPLKKTKLSERELQKGLEEIVAVGKSTERARKDKEREIERQRKEAERKKKEAEREEKRAALEIERQAREEKRRKLEVEKKKKEEEHLKKERSQLRLGSFFVAPSPNKPREGLTNVKAQSLVNSTISIVDTKSEASQAIEKSTQLLSPYSKLFPDFFIQNGVTLAPSNRFKLDEISLKRAQDNIDKCISSSHLLEKPPKIRDTLNLSSKKHLHRGRAHHSTRQIIEDFYHGRPNTKNAFSPYHTNEQLFKSIPLKSLKFHEDVRPPYVGTYSSLPIHGIAKLARNPLRKDLPNVDYEYDSEAEWLEDEEGEDLRSDDEEDDVDDAEDIDGFLDDENDENPRSRQFDLSGDLEPISTGLCWEDCGTGTTNSSLEIYRIEFILDTKMTSIDPFSTSYWASTAEISDNNSSNLKTLGHSIESHNGIKNSAAPKSDGLLLSTASKNQPSTLQSVTWMSKLKNKETHNLHQIKLIAPEDMEEFKTAVVGSDLSKIGLIEVLKKKFPGRPAAAIKSTLELIARRGQKGQKEAEKRWTLV